MGTLMSSLCGESAFGAQASSQSFQPTQALSQDFLSLGSTVKRLLCHAYVVHVQTSRWVLDVLSSNVG